MSVAVTTRQALAARLLSALLAAFCCLLPVTAVLLPHWPAVQLWCFGLLLPLLAYLAQGQRPRPDPILLALIGAVFAWALLSTLWAFAPGEAALLALRSGATLLVAVLLADCFAQLPPALARRALRWLLPGFALAFLLLLEERASGLAIMQRLAGVSYDGVRQLDHLNRSAMGLALMGFAAALQLWQVAARWTAFALLALLIATLPFFSSSAALLASAVGLLLLGASLWRRHLGQGLLLAGLLLALPLMPLVAWLQGTLHLAEAPWLGITAQARAYIWDFTLQRVLERPLLGWGMDAAPAMPNFGVQPFFKFEDKVIPLHPHSVGLQVWLDLGLVGVLLVLAPLLRLWRGLARLTPAAAAFTTALAGALLVAGGLSFGLWQSRWLGLLLLALLLLRLVRRAEETA